MTRRGFTLIETVAVIAILGLVSVALQSAITYFYKSNRQVLQSMIAASSARTGIDMLVRNLQETTYGDDGSYPITEAATSTLTFFSNTDSDSAVEKVHWYIANNTLYRATVEPSDTAYTDSEIINSSFAITPNASSTPLFQYYDSSGTGLVSPIDVSKIAAVRAMVTVGTTTKMFVVSGFASLRTLQQ